MTKKKRIITRLLVVLAALTLISCCFLGSTFARYTTGKEGTAAVGVAKWAVTLTNENVETSTTTTKFGNLSPALGNFNASTNRVNKTDKTLVATIKSESDVAAEITFTIDALKFYKNATEEVDDGDVLAKAQSVLSIKYYYSTVASPAQDSDYTAIVSSTGINSTKLVIAGKLGTNPVGAIDQATTIKIYAEAVWTSQDTSNTEADSDAIDTKVGENVASVSAKITYKAVQATEVHA